MGEGDRRAKIESVFNEAASIDASRREAFLRDRYAGDSDLRAEIESMLARHDALTAGFLEVPAGGGEIGEVLSAARAGERATIGPYTILDTLGEGGFGVVYLAEQSEPVRRRVALKVIKPGMDSNAVLARFEAERQALALMDHPCIAKVFDAGQSEEGRPYFVMERVKGMPITEFCDLHKVGIRDRINIFIDVCDAIQHAHQKGLIHRDIKPSNILVEYEGTKITPMVIDFGVAKALSQKLTEKTIFTEQGQLIGTPEYMSPEQAEMTAMDIDTRADIYSLGVLLYELLTGRLPFEPEELRSAGFAEIQRIIREVDPPKPSTRLSTMLGKKEESEVVSGIVSARASSISDLPRRLRGDLDWIVMKCLEKSLVRWYATANGVAEELKRYLNHEPVLAGPPSVSYRVNKFVKRNRAGVIAAATLFVVLTAGLIGTAYGLVEATAAREAEAAQRAVAEQRADELSEVVAFQYAQLSGVDPHEMGMQIRADLLEKAQSVYEFTNVPEAETIERLAQLETHLAGLDFTGLALESLDENIFQRALNAIETEFDDQPRVKARLIEAIARTMAELGLVTQSIPLHEQALQIRRAELGDHSETIAILNSLGIGQLLTGRFDEAEQYMRESISLSERLEGKESIGTLISRGNLANLYHKSGRPDEGVAELRDVLETLRRTQGNDDANTLNAVAQLGSMLFAAGNLDEAEPLYREALESRRRVFGDVHEDTLSSINNVGFLLSNTGRLDEAEPLLREAVAGNRALLGDEHHSTLAARNNFGGVLDMMGRLEESEAEYRDALAICRRVRGPEHPATLRFMNNLAVNLGRQGRRDEADAIIIEVLEIRKRVLGERHPETIASIVNHGTSMWWRNRLPEAESYYKEALALRREALSPQHPETLIVMYSLSRVLQLQGKANEAEPLLREVIETQRETLGDKHPQVLSSLATLGLVLLEQGNWVEAENVHREVVEGRREILPETDWRIAFTDSAIGEALVGQARFEEAEPLLIASFESLEANPETPRDPTDRLAHACSRIVALYEAWNDAAPSEFRESALEIWQTRLEGLSGSDAESE